MSDGSKVSQSPCMYCRVVKTHLQSCPHDNPLAQMIWKDGYRVGLEGGSNTHADDPTYTLGYTSGDLDAKQRAKEAKKEHECAHTGRQPIVVEDLDENARPPRRVSLPSVTELGLALHETRHDPPKPPGQAFMDAQLAQAERVIY